MARDEAQESVPGATFVRARPLALARCCGCSRTNSRCRSAGSPNTRRGTAGRIAAAHHGDDRVRYYIEDVRDEVDPSPSAPWSRNLFATTGAGEPVETADGYRVVVVDAPSSGEIRDLASYRRDLELARVYATELARRDLDELENSRDPKVALWLAAIVCYGRAFNTGVRRHPLDTSGLSPTQLEAHRFFLDMRNKHVAHAVNDYEQTIVVAYLTNSAFAPPAVTRTGQVHVEYLGAEQDDLAMLVQLCDYFTRAINRRLRALHLRLAQELAEMGEEAVYALQDLAVPSPQRERVTRRRG